MLRVAWTATPGYCALMSIRVRLTRGGFELDADLRSEARITGLFGPSGCGKTTLLDAIAGMVRPREGKMVVYGSVYFDSAAGVHLSPRRRRLGYVFQDDRLFGHLNVRDNVLFGFRRVGAGERRFEPDEIVDLLGLGSVLDQRVTEISGGERRRTALARALLSSPRLLLLDEPLTGLDRPLRRRVLAYLLRIREALDIRMLYVSHTFSDLLALADVMCVMREGRIVRTGAPSSLLGEVIEDEEAGPLETVLQGEVIETRPSQGYALVRVGEVSLRVPCVGVDAGSEVLVTVRAEDVIVAVDRKPVTSARNVLRGRVAELRSLASRVVLTVDVGVRLLVEVTEEAVKELKLERGRELYLLVKTRSLRAVAIGAPSGINPA